MKNFLLIAVLLCASIASAQAQQKVSQSISKKPKGLVMNNQESIERGANHHNWCEVWMWEPFDDVFTAKSMPFLKLQCQSIVAHPDAVIAMIDPDGMVTNLEYVEFAERYICKTDAATSTISSATLNTNYPDVPVGYMVLAPAVGETYVKAAESGTSDVWMTITAPITP